MAGQVKIGTSGYSFDDWTGVFYPETIKKGEMLPYYAQHFDTVEVNSTYYRIPPARVFDSMAKRTPEDFEFMVKAHQSATHRRNQMEAEMPKYLEAIQPLVDNSKLRGILAQFPWSFKASNQNAAHILRCREKLGADKALFVEFRHNSWIRQETFDWLKRQEIGYVAVDEPQLQGMVDDTTIATTSIGYVRLHGRNADQWWDGGPLRYDYLYQDWELEEWVVKIKGLQTETEKVYVFFNNCHEGQAVTNARRILEMIDVAQA
jgi:uncharacterized protein YecE (DUF72 family)